MPQYRKSSVLYDAHAPPLRGKEAPLPRIVIPTTPDDFFEASHELHQSGERRRAIAMLKKISEPLLRKPREQLSREESRLVMKACIRLMGIAQEDPIGDVEGLQEAVEAAATLVDLKVSPSTLGYLGWAQYLQACESSNPRVRETLCRGSLEAMRHALRLPAASSSQPLSTSSTSHPNCATSNTSNKENTQKSSTQLVLRAAFVLAYNGFPFDAVEVLESAVSTKQHQHHQHGDTDAPSTTETTNMSSELLLLGALHLSLDQTDAATSIFDRLCADVPSSPHGRLAEFMRVLCVLNYSGGTNRALVDYQIRGLLLKLSDSQGGGGEYNNEGGVGGGGGADLPSSSPPAGLDASGLRDDPEYESTSTLPPNNSTTSLPPPLSPSHTIGMLLTAARISGLAGSFNTALFAVDAATRIVEAEAASAAPTTTISGDSGPPMLAMEPSCMSSSPILLKIAAAVAAEKGRICTWKANASVAKDDKASLFEAASIQFQAALNLHRYNYEALLGRAAAMRDHGVDMPEAIVEYRKLFGLFPRSVEAVGGLVSCCRAAGQGKVPVSDHIEGVPRSSPTSEYVSIPSLAVYASKLSRRHSKGQISMSARQLESEVEALNSEITRLRLMTSRCLEAQANSQSAPTSPQTPRYAVNPTIPSLPLPTDPVEALPSIFSGREGTARLFGVLIDTCPWLLPVELRRIHDRSSRNAEVATLQVQNPRGDDNEGPLVVDDVGGGGDDDNAVSDTETDDHGSKESNDNPPAPGNQDNNSPGCSAFNKSGEVCGATAVQGQDRCERHPFRQGLCDIITRKDTMCTRKAIEGLYCGIHRLRDNGCISLRGGDDDNKEDDMGDGAISGASKNSQGTFSKHTAHSNTIRTCVAFYHNGKTCGAPAFGGTDRCKVHPFTENRCDIITKGHTMCSRNSINGERFCTQHTVPPAEFRCTAYNDSDSCQCKKWIVSDGRCAMHLKVMERRALIQ